MPTLQGLGAVQGDAADDEEDEELKHTLSPWEPAEKGRELSFEEEDSQGEEEEEGEGEDVELFQVCQLEALPAGGCCLPSDASRCLVASAVLFCTTLCCAVPCVLCCAPRQPSASHRHHTISSRSICITPACTPV